MILSRFFPTSTSPQTPFLPQPQLSLAMPPRRANGVTGPSSALTSFLRASLTSASSGESSANQCHVVVDPSHSCSPSHRSKALLEVPPRPGGINLTRTSPCPVLNSRAWRRRPRRKTTNRTSRVGADLWRRPVASRLPVRVQAEAGPDRRGGSL